MSKLSKLGWGLFWFLSLLNTFLVFRFFLPGLNDGFLPNLDMGFFAALYEGAVVGVQKGFGHVAYQLEDRFSSLYTHMLFGGVAMAFIPFQLWTRFRMKRPKIHKWMGRIAIVSILLASTSAALLGLNMNIPDWGRAGFAIGASVWFLTAIFAFWFAWKRDFAKHKQWMIIVAAVTFGAVTLRFEFPLFREFGIPFEISYAMAGWSSWVGNIAAVLLWQRFARNRRAMA